MSIEWYFMRDGIKHGPISSKQLKELADSGKIQPTDLIWKQGFSDWRPAAVLTVLFDSTGNRAVEPDPSHENISAETTCKKPRFVKAKRPFCVAVLAASGVLLLGGYFAWVKYAHRGQLSYKRSVTIDHQGDMPVSQSSMGTTATTPGVESSQKLAESDQQQTGDPVSSASTLGKGDIIVHREGDRRIMITRPIAMKPRSFAPATMQLPDGQRVEETFGITILVTFDPNSVEALPSEKDPHVGESASQDELYKRIHVMQMVTASITVTQKNSPRLLDKTATLSICTKESTIIERASCQIAKSLDKEGSNALFFALSPFDSLHLLAAIDDPKRQPFTGCTRFRSRKTR